MVLGLVASAACWNFHDSECSKKGERIMIGVRQTDRRVRNARHWGCPWVIPRIVASVLLLWALALGTTTPSIVSALPNYQTGWYRYTGFVNTPGRVAFHRASGPGYTNEGTSKDSYLRSPSNDVYLDTYYMGNVVGAPNTSDVTNNFTSYGSIRLCYFQDFVSTNRTIPQGSWQVPRSGGLMSWRGPSCS
jgi:hypothetical protein